MLAEARRSLPAPADLRGAHGQGNLAPRKLGTKRGERLEPGATSDCGSYSSTTPGSYIATKKVTAHSLWAGPNTGMKAHLSLAERNRRDLGGRLVDCGHAYDRPKVDPLSG